MAFRLMAIAGIVLGVVLPGLVWAEARVADVRADALKVDHGKRTAVFERNVRATYANLTIRCQRMVVAYGDGGDIVSLVASGNVVVKRGEIRATAGRARLDVSGGQLVLDDNPRVAQNRHQLAGTRISIELKTGKIDVLEARGTFQLQLQENQ